jgi:hypothetical protein
MSRRQVDSVRKLPSGRYRASYWHLADRHIGPRTFATKGGAQTWLSTVETDTHTCGWVDPIAGTLGLRHQLTRHGELAVPK